MTGFSEFHFDLLAPTKIVFGWGRRDQAGTLAKTLGRRAFVVCGSGTLARAGVFAEIEQRLQAAGVATVPLASIAREPQTDDVDRAVAALSAHAAGPGDLVIALGGGSAIDLAKASAALATNGCGPVRDYLEGVGKGLKIESPPLPVLAIPTTAGTGSEATKNSVISSVDPPFKKSLRSDAMIPRIVLIDPELTVPLPPATTAYTGMDALTQLIESYLSRRAQPIPQALALSGLEAGLPAIVRAVEQGTDRDARERMAYAALLSGMALANSGLGFAHGVAAALGIHCGVPHGLACAVMLPAALRLNRDVRRAEMARLWSLVDSRANCPAEEAAARWIAHVDQIIARVGIPSRLSAIGVRREQIPALVKGSRGNSMDGNPRDVSDEEIRSTLEAMF